MRSCESPGVDVVNTSKTDPLGVGTDRTFEAPNQGVGADLTSETPNQGAGAASALETERTTDMNSDADTNTDEYDILDEPEMTVSPLANSHPDQADAISMPRDVRQRPGLLHTSGALLLHTKQAHRLFYGRRGNEKEGKHLIVGLVRFAADVRACWEAAAADDPYADLVLLDVEAAYAEAVTGLDETLKYLTALVDSMDGLSVNISQSVRPVEMSLNFSSPWGFRGASVLAKFDAVVKLCLTASHVGLLLSDEREALLHRQRRLVRKVYAQSMKFVHTAVTRNDCAANNKVAQRAKEKYAARDMPAEVLRGDQRALLSPPIVIKVSEGTTV